MARTGQIEPEDLERGIESDVSILRQNVLIIGGASQTRFRRTPIADLSVFTKSLTAYSPVISTIEGSIFGFFISPILLKILPF